MSIGKAVVGGVITLVIGGSAYTINKTDIAKNFAEDTGMSQQQAEQFVNNMDDEDLVPFDELGDDYIDEGQGVINYSVEIDCVNYQYEWETYSLSCSQGKSQMSQIGRDMVALGKSYKILGSDSADRSDISNAITLIDKLSFDYKLPIVYAVLDKATVTEMQNNNSYNKALLKTALESE